MPNIQTNLSFTVFTSRHFFLVFLRHFLIKFFTNVSDPLIAVTTDETHYSPRNCAHIHCLVTVNVQQLSMSVNGCSLFTWMNSMIHLCFVSNFKSVDILSVYRSAVICNKEKIWVIERKVQLLLAYHEHWPLKSWLYIEEDIIFRAAKKI